MTTEHDETQEPFPSDFLQQRVDQGHTSLDRTRKFQSFARWILVASLGLLLAVVTTIAVVATISYGHLSSVADHNQRQLTADSQEIAVLRNQQATLLNEIYLLETQVVGLGAKPVVGGQFPAIPAEGKSSSGASFSTTAPTSTKTTTGSSSTSRTSPTTTTTVARSQPQPSSPPTTSPVPTLPTLPRVPITVP